MRLRTASLIAAAAAALLLPGCASQPPGGPMLSGIVAWNFRSPVAPNQERLPGTFGVADLASEPAYTETGSVREVLSWLPATSLVAMPVYSVNQYQDSHGNEFSLQDREIELLILNELQTSGLAPDARPPGLAADFVIRGSVNVRMMRWRHYSGVGCILHQWLLIPAVLLPEFTGRAQATAKLEVVQSSTGAVLHSGTYENSKWFTQWTYAGETQIYEVLGAKVFPPMMAAFFGDLRATTFPLTGSAP